MFLEIYNFVFDWDCFRITSAVYFVMYVTRHFTTFVHKMKKLAKLLKLL